MICQLSMKMSGMFRSAKKSISW